ncbi:hypothetical protein CC80DRAFT_543073 [Byssothecium circinans]|uniref:Uncharacterized protein n=1 Tax=Byssothecium circinans TaxID=147558 RepID=A0A6A5UBK6_9PLEO|nr:hypothetical protein CC80DRAFT_543073 [Byssothecium circinans]
MSDPPFNNRFPFTNPFLPNTPYVPYHIVPPIRSRSYMPDDRDPRTIPVGPEVPVHDVPTINEPIPNEDNPPLLSEYEIAEQKRKDDAKFDMFRRVFTYFFQLKFEDWNPDWEITPTTLLTYNLHYRPQLDALTRKMRKWPEYRDLMRECFWSVLGEHVPVRIQRRHNVTAKPWAFPRPQHSRFVRKLEIVMDYKDRYPVEATGLFLERQGDWSIVEKLMKGKYGFEALESVVVHVQNTPKEMGKMGEELQEVKGNFNFCADIGFGKEGLKALVWMRMHVSKVMVERMWKRGV